MVPYLVEFPKKTGSHMYMYIVCVVVVFSRPPNQRDVKCSHINTLILNRCREVIIGLWAELVKEGGGGVNLEFRLSNTLPLVPASTTSRTYTKAQLNS